MNSSSAVGVPQHTVAAHPGPIDAERRLALYRALLLPRLVEERMLILLRQGRLSKWFSGIGQEAIAVGVASALEPDDWILPMHRNLGVFTARGVDLLTPVPPAARQGRRLHARAATARSTSARSRSASSG